MSPCFKIFITDLDDMLLEHTTHKVNCRCDLLCQ